MSSPGKDSSPEQEYWLEACRAEEEAWQKVKDRPPGTLGHDSGAWARWQQALKRVTEAARLYQSKNSS
jgi:hypothetical protein